MNTSTFKLHPVLWVAAVAVILLSAAGLGAIFGVIPHVGSTTTEAVAPVTSPTTMAPAPTPAPVATSQPMPSQQGTEVAPLHKKAATHHEPTRFVQEYQPVPAPGMQASQAVTPSAPPPCRNCGVIESLREIAQQGEGSALGVVAGGVLGGVLGHQVGGGRGKDLATVAGALGGAYAGHEVEKNVRKTVKYETIVRYEDGTSQKFMQDGAPGWRQGDHVRVDNGVIMAR